MRTGLSWLFASAILLYSCSEEPEDPGLCNLNCSSAIIGPIEGSIEIMAQSSGVTCAAGAQLTALNDPLTFYFRMIETFDNDGTDKILPKPSVSIEPIVNGLMSEEAIHNPNVVIDGDTFTPARYKGIITPSSNWCTDACGVATIEVFPLCPPAGETSTVNVQIHSGALFSEPASVTIQTQDAN
ncbi:hypothetical protein [Pseudobacteriovorax antillogorgiicola]|uniref:Uncharacterized protein n=1 Tax=Pseudobacteriovorax antillogorgiicola TaxID=1513793 RepID=A0A1Y6BAJ6_9BACT|nr:hypothetical protein [Pseudobacteriovorax antillogorgiicola]TCS58912.1 hypothetical protein EDD56_102427 [Pseudobacteriovorax antillogorgiicola]SME93289.1 hypothetical protein SAMN06296036_10216 [Pseudobacteriovorax antillogorgiicola]